eukprot:366345-Chlamydomonas_euryale.AAC.20
MPYALPIDMPARITAMHTGACSRTSSQASWDEAPGWRSNNEPPATGQTRAWNWYIRRWKEWLDNSMPATSPNRQQPNLNRQQPAPPASN